MLTYLTLDGEVLNLSDLTPAELSRFNRAYEAYRGRMDFAEFRSGPGAWGFVDRALFTSPLFRAVQDLGGEIERMQLLGLRQLRLQKPEAEFFARVVPPATAERNRHKHGQRGENEKESALHGSTAGTFGTNGLAATLS